MKRPQKEAIRSEEIKIKVTDEEKKRIRMEADIRGMTVSEFIRKAIYDENLHMETEELEDWMNYRKNLKKEE